MTTVGTLKEIWRYPVKSMSGHTMSRVAVNENGVVGDRIWATRNDTQKEIQGAKKFPLLMRCSARLRGEPEDNASTPVDIVMPDGGTSSSDDSRINEKLSALVGQPISLWPLRPPTDAAHYRRRPMNEQEFAAEMQDIFQREAGEPFPALEQFPKEILEYTSFPGMYFDVTPLHILTTSSLAALAQKNPSANWDVRRFRPNFLIDTGSTAALRENDWIGKQLHIGDVVIAIAAPTPRCGMTTREQDRLPFDKSILRTIVRDADQNLGAYAVVVKSGTVCAGDKVTLVDTQ